MTVRSRLVGFFVTPGKVEGRIAAVDLSSSSEDSLRGSCTSYAGRGPVEALGVAGVGLEGAERSEEASEEVSEEESRLLVVVGLEGDEDGGGTSGVLAAVGVGGSSSAAPMSPLPSNGSRDSTPPDEDRRVRALRGVRGDPAATGASAA